MIGMSVKFIGVQAVMNLMKKKMVEIDKRLTKDLLACTIKVEGDSKKKCPVLTGRLRSSITHEVKDRVGKVGTNVKYAKRIEFGFQGTDSKGRTYNQSPQSYLYSALRDNFAFIKKKLGNSVVTSLKEK